MLAGAMSSERLTGARGPNPKVAHSHGWSVDAGCG